MADVLLMRVGVDEVDDVRSSHHDRVRDQATVAVPPQRLRAHDRGRPVLVAQQPDDRVTELGRIGVVGVGPERGVAPRGMARALGAPPSAPAEHGTRGSS